jgi:phosphotransferase system  glucose/maltose/N-acetylglucosamine-specific IIC component
MNIFQFITQGFIDFFGITQPTPRQERRAMLFICSLLALVIVMAVLVFALIVMAFGRH